MAMIDYVDTLTIVAVWIATLLIQVCTSPHEMPVVKPASNPLIAYPFTEPQVPDLLLFIFVLGLPMMYFIGVAVAQRYFGELSWVAQLKTNMLAYHSSISFNGFVTVFIKRLVGRLRPNFLSYCKWSAEAEACTADEGVIAEARSSFPSGHSSFAFAALTSVSLHLLQKLRVFETKGRSDFLWRVILALSPMLFASWIAITRVQDYWHDYIDIFSGSVIGFSLAVFFRNIFDNNAAAAAATATTAEYRREHDTLAKDGYHV